MARLDPNTVCNLALLVTPSYLILGKPEGFFPSEAKLVSYTQDESQTRSHRASAQSHDESSKRCDAYFALRDLLGGMEHSWLA